MSDYKPSSKLKPVDSTRYNELQQELEQLQKHHELILHAAGEGIYGLDCQGHTTFVNQAAAIMVGWTLSEMVGKSQHLIIHHTKPDGGTYQVEDCPIYAAFKDGKVHQVDTEVFWRKDGSCFPVEYVSTPIKDDQGNMLGAVVVFKDITRRKRSEKALQEANQELQAALKEVQSLKNQLQQENAYLQQEIKLSHNFEEIISQSKKFKKVLGSVEQVAITDATVLILGESGTGKELVARAVHNLSSRRERALVKVNCAALPAGLIESELFGHEKGAFTGALNKKIGRFELANGGTIFLDEVGEIPIELQSKLLRVLQEGEFERLGSSHTIKVNVRVIAATNKRLEDAIKAGTFREDLYYRLNVFPLELPSLRERKEDVPLLAQHFLRKYSAQFGKNITAITNRSMESLLQYSWPGNVRELENIIERAIITSRGRNLEIGTSLPAIISSKSDENKIIPLEENEKYHILRALKATNWRVSGEKGAAKLLGLKRTTLEARMKKLKVTRP